MSDRQKMASRGRPFAKGVSGNPKGRPRKACVAVAESGFSGSAALIVENASKPTTIVENGEPRTVSQAEAVRQRQFVDAARGGARQQQDYLTSLRQAEERLKKQREEEFEELSSLESTLQERRRVYDELEYCGDPLPKGPYFDPREMVVDLRTRRILQNGPLGDHEKGQWDEERERARLLREDGERTLESLPDEPDPVIRESLRGGALSQLQMAADIASIFPDEQTRRAKGYDLGQVRLHYFNRPDVLAKMKKIEAARRAG